MMKTAVLLITLIVGQSLAIPLHIQKPKAVHKALMKADPTLDLCGVCIQFSVEFINQLLNIILNAGVIGGCSELCSMLPANKIEIEVCDLLCAIVGIEAFIKIIQEADLDPIYYCELLRACAIKDDGDATITSLTITPNPVIRGSSFTIAFSFTTKNGTGTGETIVNINTQDHVPLFGSNINKPFSPGDYNVNVKASAKPDPDCDPTQGPCESWIPGNYSVEIAICNGECGSKHPHSQVYDTKTAPFTVKGNDN